MTPPATPPTGDTGRPKAIPIGFGSLWRAVRRYSLLVFVFALLAAAAAAVVYFFLPLPKMTAQMVFFVNQTAPYKLTPGVLSSKDPAAYRVSLQNVFKRRLFLSAVMSEPGIASLPMFETDKSQEPTDILKSAIRVDWSYGPEHMRVSIEGNEQQEILALLNAVKTVYTKEVLNEDMRERSQKMESMTSLQRKYQQEMKTQRDKIRNVLTTTFSTDPTQMEVANKFLNSKVAYMDSEKIRLDNRIRELNFQKNRIDNEMKLPANLRRSVPKELVEQYVLNDPTLINMQKTIDTLSAKLIQYQERAAPGTKSPGMASVEKEIADLQVAMTQHADRARPAILARLKDEQAKGEKFLQESVQQQLDIVLDQKKEVESSWKAALEEIKSLKEQNSQVEPLRGEIATTETMLAQINSEIVRLNPELEAPPRITMWDEPYAFVGIEGNRRVKYTAIAAVVFLILGLVLAQWLELRNRRIQSLDEITQGLGLQVLGTVPAMPKGGVNANSNWPHLLTEAVNTTRTMLLSGPNSSTHRTLLVTSAMSGEGKTSLTTHLAVSLANSGRRVLLIDADMRRPAVHRVLGLESKPGLAELLIGTEQFGNVVQACKIPNLHLIPAGAWSREAAASLSSESWPRVLHEAAQDFDFVLVDSPPILPVADALAIARNVDGVLISVMQDQSRYGAVQTACQRLNMVGAKVLGVVVSGMKSFGGYYYYYYYDERYSKPNAQPAAEPSTSETAN
jgi:capsular exopolysaccharide synthesis family protein